jgi:hypothetical protein
MLDSSEPGYARFHVNLSYVRKMVLNIVFYYGAGWKDSFTVVACVVLC